MAKTAAAKPVTAVEEIVVDIPAVPRLVLRDGMTADQAATACKALADELNVMIHSRDNDQDYDDSKARELVNSVSQEPVYK